MKHVPPPPKASDLPISSILASRGRLVQYIWRQSIVLAKPDKKTVL